MALAGNFGDGKIAPDDIAAGLHGAVVEDEEKDAVVRQEYLGKRREEAGFRVAAAVFVASGACITKVGGFRRKPEGA